MIWVVGCVFGFAAVVAGAVFVLWLLDEAMEHEDE